MRGSELGANGEGAPRLSGWVWYPLTRIDPLKLDATSPLWGEVRQNRAILIAKRALRAVVWTGTLGTVVAAGLLAAWVQHVAANLPSFPALSEIATSTIVVDRDGRLLRPFTIADGRWRLPATRADVDPKFFEMLLAYEDRRFHQHDGVDWLAMLRASAQFVLSGQIVSGGSTLTMQVARLLDGGDTRNAAGKVRQMAAALALERRYGKDEILDLYLALAPYGGNVEGIRAATLAYFGKEPKRLTTAEAALLVAIPQSPEARRPDRDVGAARRARDRVLDRLAGQGVLTTDAAAAAKTEAVPDGRRPFPMLAPHLAVAAVEADPAAPVHRLTIARDLQASLETLAAGRAAALGPNLSVAILVADQMSGAVVASVGSPGLTDDARAGYLDMTRAVRSPGSTLKPLIYGLAFEQGLAHPESLIEDRPSAFSGYVPENFDGRHRGTVTVREALTQSLNVPAIAVLDGVGPAMLVARLKRAAVTAVLPDHSAPGLAVGLGGVGVSLRDLVALYVAIARGGAPIALRDGVTAPGDGSGAPVLNASAAWYVADILAGTPPPVTGSPGRIAYKTGTSYGYRDAWAIGFDGQYVIGVWIGRPDGTAVPDLSGIASAAPILFEAFDRIGPKRVPLRAAPGGTITAATAALPAPLRIFRDPNATDSGRDNLPEIAFPADGVAVDLGIAAGKPMPLTIKVRDGRPPFTFFVNGVPIARPPFARAETWMPDGPGYVTLSVVDAGGRADRVTVFVE
jgi:penicillin-binding protein 1C